MSPRSLPRHGAGRNQIGERVVAASEQRDRLVRLCAALAARAKGQLEACMRDLSQHAGEAEGAGVEEVLLQSYLFLGYPTALNAIALWRRLSGRPPPSPAEDDWEAWVSRGGEVCRQVYGGQYGILRENVRALHPDLERWMVAEGYGKVLGRPGLDLVDRELCIVAMLAVQDSPRQLYSHLRGALNAGATEEDVEGVLEEAREFTDGHTIERAWDGWRLVRERQKSAGLDSGSGPRDSAGA